GSRSLILERLLQLPRPGLLCLEQPRVLDEDDRLVGKGLEQLDGRTSVRRLTIAPMASPARIRGRLVWCGSQDAGRSHCSLDIPPSPTAHRQGGSFARSRTARPTAPPRVKGKVPPVAAPTDEMCPRRESIWSTSPSFCVIAVSYESQRVAADSTSVSRTLGISKVARLMTLSTSAVAICCWRDSCSSRLLAYSASKRRAFSMAITAWSAKVWSSSTCFSENDPGWS